MTQPAEAVVRAGDADRPRYALADLLWYFLRLGTLGFGGPIALCGYMQRDLVDQRGWITPEDYKQGLALAQLAPGPLAAQLAMYLGWVRGRMLGATLVGRSEERRVGKEGRTDGSNGYGNRISVKRRTHGD